MKRSITHNLKITIILHVCVIGSIFGLKAQDFYLDGLSGSSPIYKKIDPKWTSLSETEARDFLVYSGFQDVSVESNGEFKIYTGKHEQGKKYNLYRSLLFKNFECFAYRDEVVMARECNKCMINKVNAPSGLARSFEKTATETDKKLKQLFIDEIKKSFEKDGIYDNIYVSVHEENWEIKKEIETQTEKIKRYASLEQIPNYNAYRMRVSKTVSKTIGGVIVSGISLSEADTYDLRGMIDIFVRDCNEHNIELKSFETIAEFKVLKDGVLGLSYGKDDDQLVKLFIDPEKWASSSHPKRWYLIYHELGHDILNLAHGNGGKMMFNFVNKAYSWEEFFEDKESMFSFYNKYYK